MPISTHSSFFRFWFLLMKVSEIRGGLERKEGREVWRERRLVRACSTEKTKTVIMTKGGFNGWDWVIYFFLVVLARVVCVCVLHRGGGPVPVNSDGNLETGNLTAPLYGLRRSVTKWRIDTS